MTFLIILLAIALQVYLTVKKVNPFISLLLVSIVAGLFLGLEPSAIVKSFERGTGATLGGLALIVCLGSVLGKVLEISGAAERIATTLINRFGEKKIQWAVMFTGLLIGLPLYYNAGFVILVPLVFTLTRKTGLPILYIAIPMAASLSTTHCFLPPHPGPVVIVNALQADTGKVLLYGLSMALPAVVIAGPFLGGWLRKLEISTPLQSTTSAIETKELPGALPSFSLALLPVLLITLNTLGQLFLSDGYWLKTLLAFVGDSTMALFLAVLLAFYQFGIRQGKSMEEVMSWLTSAISGIAMILFIITAGGIFKQVLQDSGTATYIASFSSSLHLPPLVFGWMITAILRVTIGSATVAGITAAGIVAPLVAAGGVSPELMVLAVGSGSVFCSHVNDSGFWMFKEFFGLTLKQTFLSWTLMETTISIIGLAGVLILDMVL